MLAANLLEIGKGDFGAFTTAMSPVRAGSLLFFLNDDGVSGSELWKSDGTAAGTGMVKDIKPGGTSNIQNLTACGSLVYFTTAGSGTPNTGVELWRSDGTDFGTFMVQDINPGFANSSPTFLRDLNGKLIFNANNGVHGSELWTSDGTLNGATLLKDINPGPSGNSINGPVVIDGTLYFGATDSSTNGNELWKSNGTAAGTVLVKDINTGSGDSFPIGFTKAGGYTYFTATTASSGKELWRTDGTTAGTSLVMDVSTNPSSNPTNNFSRIVEANGKAYFTASNSGTGGAVTLWQSDPVTNVTTAVKALPSSTPFVVTILGVANNSVLFLGNDGTTGLELWASDGTSAGTGLLKDVNPGTASSNITNTRVIGSTLIFTADDGAHGAELWRSDGTAAGTSILKDIYPGATGGSTSIATDIGNGTAYFSANDGSTGLELWQTDGTAAGTVNVNINTTPRGYSPSSVTPTPFGSVNGLSVFPASDGVSGFDLWSSDGTAAGTRLLKDINPGSGDSYPAHFTPLNGSLYFNAINSTNGDELWKSDGTAAGTVLVKDINPGGSGGSPWPMVNAGGTLFFRASNGTNGFEVWKSDGTAAGTVLVKDLVSGSGSSFPDYFTAAGSKAFFVATGINSSSLYVTDGTDANTILLRTFSTSFDSNSSFAAIGGTLYFSASDGTNGQELWKSDGTAAGTVLVKDIYAGASGSRPNYLVSLNGTVFFAATDPTNGQELWKSDGTAAGTVLVKNIGPSSNSGSPINLAVAGNRIYFGANDGVTGSEPWVSDGTAAGTALIKDVTAGSLNSFPAQFTNVNGMVYFVAGVASVATGTEVWQTDGTAAGTSIVRDTAPGTKSSSPTVLTAVGGSLFFLADDGVNGREVWSVLPDQTTATIGPGAATLAEGLSQTLTISLDRAYPKTVILNLAVTGTASPGDYSLSATSVTIPAGQTTASVTLTATDDAIYEGDERAIVTLQPSSDPNVLFGATTSATITIGDDDPMPTVSLTSAAQSVGEAAGVVTVTAQLSAPSGLDTVLTFAASGTAALGVDFTYDTPSGDPVLVIPAGAISASLPVRIIDDANKEPSETIALALAAGVGPGAVTVHTITILDNEPSVLTLSSSVQSLGEGQAGVLVASLDRPVAFDVVAPLTRTATSNASAADYRLSTASFLIPAGQTSGSVSVTSFDDALHELDEELYLALGDPNKAGVTLGTTQATTVHLTLLDDDPMPTVDLSTSAQSDGEANNYAVVYVRLSAVSGLDTVLTFSASGTATLNDDYRFDTPSGIPEIVIPAGSLEGYLVVPIVNDTTTELNETIVLTLASATNATVGATKVQTITIVDNDSVIVTLSTTVLSLNEGQVGTITAALDRTAPFDVRVPVVSLTESQASAGDYALSSPTILIPAGQTLGSVTVTAVDDALYERDEDLYVKLGDPNQLGVILGSEQATTGTLTIHDNDPMPVVNLTATSQSVDEGVGIITVTAKLSAVSGIDTHVGFYVGGTATTRSDFKFFNGEVTPSLIIPAGAISASMPVEILDDSSKEPTETIVLTLWASSGYATVGSPNVQTITIRDNEPAVLSISPTQATFSEGGTTILTAYLDRPVTFDVRVPLALSGLSSALAGDYTLSSPTILIAAGQLQGSATVTAVADGLFETDEMLVLGLVDPNQAGVVLNGFNGITAFLTLHNGDPAPRVWFTSAGGTFAESAGTRTITLQISAPSSQPVTVPILLSGTAYANIDYTLGGTVATSSGDVIRIPAGKTTGTLSLTIVDDTSAESNESLTVRLGTPLNGSAVLETATTRPTSYTATILDDDAVTVTFTAAAKTVTEGALTFVTAHLDRPSPRDQFIRVNVGGTALRNSDYTDDLFDESQFYGVPTYKILIPAGRTDATLGVQTKDDTLAEAAETVTLSLVGGGNVSVGATGRFELAINDNDTPVVAMAAASQTVWEDSGTLNVRVSLSNVSTVPVTVPITVYSGTARAISDFVLGTASVTIPAGLKSGSVPVAIVDDTLLESDESFTLKLGTPVNATLTGDATKRTFTTTIKDNDRTVSFTLDKQTVSEGGGGAVTVTLNGPLNRDVYIPMRVTDITAVGGADYQDVDARVWIPAGYTKNSFVFHVLDDTLIEGPETFSMQIGTLPTGLRPGLYPKQVVTIPVSDAAKPSVNWSYSRVNTYESVLSQYQLTASLNTAFPDVVTVNVASSGGTNPLTFSPATGADVRLSSSVLVFQPYQLQASISVTVIDDKLVEPSESAILSLTRPSNAILGTSGPLTLWVMDNDAPAPPPSAPAPAPGVPSTGGTSPTTPTTVAPPEEVHTLPQGTAPSTVAVDVSGDTTNLPSYQPAPLPTNIQDVTNIGIVTLPPGGIAVGGASTDGPIAGAIIFFDANLNGVLDFLDLNGDGAQDLGEPDEPVAVTAANGTYSIWLDTAFDRDQDGSIDLAEGQYVSSGGVDSSTNLPVGLTLTAPVGSTTISPLTTLVNALIRASGMSVVEANARVSSALGLPVVDLTRFWAPAGVLNGNEDSPAVMAAGVAVQDTAVQVAGLIAGSPDSPGRAYVAAMVFADLADKIAAVDSTFDLASRVQVGSLIEGTLSRVGLGLDPSILEGAAAVIAEGNGRAFAITPSATVGYLADLARVQVVAQGQVADELGSAVAGRSVIDDVVAGATGEALAAAIAAAEVGDVMPPSLSVSDTAVREGDDGITYAELSVTLDRPSLYTVTVDYVTSDGTAVAGTDYDAVSGTLTWGPGDAQPKVIRIPIRGDGTFEFNESLLVRLANPVRAAIAKELGQMTIVSDDVLVYEAPSGQGPNHLRLTTGPASLTLYRNDEIVLTGILGLPVPVTIRGADAEDDELIVDLSQDTRQLRAGLIFIGGAGQDDGISVLVADPSGLTLTRGEAGSGRFRDGTAVIDYSGVDTPVGNVAPTASLSDNGDVTYGTTSLVEFSDPFDPSTSDSSAGFHYAFATDAAALAATTYADAGAEPSHAFDLDAGEHTIYARILDRQGGFTDYSTTVHVARATVTIDVRGYTGTYDGQSHGATGSAIGVRGESLSGLDLGARYVDAPGGMALWSFSDASGNYEGAAGDAAIVINKAELAIRWETPEAITYGTALGGTQFNATASTAGTFTYGPGSGTVLNAGDNQSLKADFTPTDTVNYNTASKTVSINVGKAPLTVTANGGSIYYGQAIPTANGTLSGVVDGDPITATYTNTAAAGSVPGNYDVSAVLNDTSNRLSNYTVTNTKGTLQILAAPTAVTVASSKASSTYGDAVTFTAKVAVTVPDDTAVPTGSVQFYVDGSTFGEPVAIGADGRVTSGSISTLTATVHQITAGFTNSDGKFVGSHNTGSPLTLSVARASTTVTLAAADATYNGTAHGATASVTGVGGLSQVLTVTYAGINGTAYSTSTMAPTNAGEYSATATYAQSANYLGSRDSKTFSIAKATLTVIANAQTKVYGADDPALTYRVGGLKLSDTAGSVLTGQLARAAGENVATSPYAIGQGTLVSNANYIIAFTDNGLTITKAALTITAENKTKVFNGLPFEDFGVGYSTFAFNETKSVLSGALLFSGNAVGAVNAGVYTITAAGQTSANYAITFVDGKLTISDASKPTTSNVVANPNPAPVGSSVVVTATLSDFGSGSSVISSAQYSINGGTTWISMQAKDGDFNSPTEVVTATIPASALPTGVYSVMVRGMDSAENDSATDNTLLAVYDPSAGFVTGSGWIISPAGSYAAEPSLTGKANFGFESKYQKGATVPTGTTEFQFQLGNLSFKSTNYEWLVVSGTTRAQFKGEGKINGAGNFGFLLTALDNGTSNDAFRIKIWDKATNNNTVYDNQMGKTESGNDATVLNAPNGGGSIVIHVPKKLQALGAVTEGSAGSQVLTQEQLQPIIAEAIARWQATGLDSAALSTLVDTKVFVADLEGGDLGHAGTDFIVLDVNAGGVGWYINSTPGDDVEFRSGSVDQAAGNRFDLLTAVMHEMGHVLGLEHDDHDDVMHEDLVAGIRRLPETLSTGTPTPTPVVTADRPAVAPGSGATATPAVALPRTVAVGAIPTIGSARLRHRQAGRPAHHSVSSYAGRVVKVDAGHQDSPLVASALLDLALEQVQVKGHRAGRRRQK